MLNVMSQENNIVLYVETSDTSGANMNVRQIVQSSVNNKELCSPSCCHTSRTFCQS